jgi:hypothetical protein
MPFDAQREKKIRDWLAKHNAPGPCASCGRNNWSMHDSIALPGTYDAGSVNPASGFGMLMFYCDNCARVVSYAAGPIVGTS